MRLSVVVTIVEGSGALERSLAALASQEDPPEFEVVVPFDASVELGDLPRRYGSARFIDMGLVTPSKPVQTPAGAHELFDRRRARGLAEARGELVGILEDRGVPRPDWCGAADRVHRRHPDAVIGGAVENAVDTTLNRALWIADFSRYLLPLAEGPANWVTDVNVCYKRDALDEIRDVWRERYHETTVHWELLRRGHRLRLDPSMVVDQHRTPGALATLLRERWHWGRLFAYTRAMECAAPRRALLTAAAPVLPPVLFARHLANWVRRRRPLGPFISSAPALLVLLAAWSLGEAMGYATRRP